MKQATLGHREPRRLTGPEKSSIALKTVFAGAESIAGVFMTLYLFQLGGFGAIALFYVTNFVVLTAAFFGAGPLMRRFSSTRAMQAGAVFLGAVYLVLLALGPAASGAVVLLGALRGIGEGLFWPAMNVAEYKVTTPATRNRYLGRATFFGALAAILGPPLASAVFFAADRTGIQSAGYYVLFVILALALAAVVRMAPSLPRSEIRRFRMSDVGTGLAHPTWRIVLSQQFLRGLWVTMFPAFSTVLLFLALKSESTVSIVVSLAAILSAGSAMAAARLLDRRPNSQAAGAIVVALGLVGFALDPGVIGVLCFVVLVKGFDPFGANAATKANYDVMDAMGVDRRDSYHLIVETEIALNAGRIVSFLAALIVLGGSGQADVVRHSMVLIAVLPLIVSWLQRRITATPALSAAT